MTTSFFSRAAILLAVCIGFDAAPAGAQTSGARAATPPATEESRRALTDYAYLLMVKRDVVTAMARYFDAKLIQHDAEIGDSGHGDEEFLSNRRKENPQQFLATEQYHTVVDNLLADGDLIAVKSHVYTNPRDPGRVFVDIWHVVGGSFVEHWDVVQPVPAAPLNDATSWCGGASNWADADKVGDTVARPGCGLSGPAANRDAALATVAAYTGMAEDPRKAAEAVERYFADDFVQHGPDVAQGKAALVAYERSHADARVAQRWKLAIARTIADGNLVLTHGRITTSADARGVARVDLYRVQSGKIVEHWDVVQPIPAFSLAGHSMVDGPLEPSRTVGTRAGP
ncbi:MAG: nuclear transport factor 2 family protein [Gammaproteobacteria bacterium]